MTGPRNTYVVEPNDTLAGIAESRLGSAHRWQEIARANGIGHFDPLLIGRPLAMPAPVMQSFDPAPRRILAAAHPAQPMERRPATTVPAWSYHFLLADEMNPFARRAVRRVLLPPRGVTDLVELERLTHPERHGFSPRDPASPVSMGRHVGGRVDSRFLSASGRSGGSPRFPGQRFWINLDKARAAGVTVHETPAIIADLDRVIARSRNAVQRANLIRIRELSLEVDHEILLEGHVPAAAIKTGPMLAATRGMQVVSGVGIVLTAYDLGRAAERSHATHSVRPLAAETVRQAGGWAGAWAGMQGGALVGGALGIETGPGALVTGFVGGAIGGVAGFLGASWIAGSIER